MSTRAPVGYVAETTSPMAFNQGCKGLIPTVDVDVRYFRYQLISMRRDLEADAQGSTFSELSGDALAAQTVVLPPLEDQRRIADFLDAETSRLYRLCDVRHRQIKVLGERASALMESSIWHDEDQAVELRRLGAGLTTGPFGTVFAADDYVEGEVPMINPVHISDGSLQPDAQHTVSAATATRLQRHQLKAGDIVAARKGDLGRSAIVKKSQEGWVCGSDSIAIRVEQGTITPDFLNHLLHLESTRAGLLARSLAATMPSLNEGMLLSIQVPVVSAGEQALRSAKAAEVRLSLSLASDAINRSMNLIRERIRALITAVVKGEIDVTTARGVADRGL